MNKEIRTMTYESSLTNLCEVNSSFDTGVLRICYTGENRNGSYISRETIERNISTIYNCPIVCNYDRETNSFGGHDMDVVYDADGNLQIINATSPVGVIPESSHVWFENYTSEDGEEHEYLYAEVLLWKRQEAYKKIKEDGIASHSMEISINKGEFSRGVYRIDDFEFNAFCLISVTPCFEDSELMMFSSDDFKQQMAEMMSDLKETFKVNSSNEVDIHPRNDSMEGGNKELDDKIKLAEQYGVNVDELDFSLEDFTAEELTEKFEAMKEPEVKEDEEVAPEPEEPEDEIKFVLTEDFVCEIARVLQAEKVMDAWGDEYPKYGYVDCDIEANEVYAWDRQDWLLYGFNFTVDGDSVTIDFASKKRKKYAIVDFEGGEQASPIAPVFEVMENKLKDCSEYESKFNEANSTIETMQAELDELRKFKADVDQAVAKNERNEILEQFEDLAGIEAFEALKEDCEKYDLETLEEKCFAIRGRFGKFAANDDKKKNPKLFVPKQNIENEPYGGLVEKYAKGRRN